MELSSWIYLNRERSRYRITVDGQVYSTEYNGVKGDVRELKISHDSDGYCIIALNHKGQKYTRKVHRLVAEAFIYNPYDLPEVNHKDGNKDNNCVDNLEWVSTYQNIHHAHDHKLRKAVNSEEAVITACELMELNLLYLSEISERTGISVPNLVKIKNKIIWKEVSDNYNIENYTMNERGRIKESAYPPVTEDIVIQICDMLDEAKLSVIDIAKKMNVSQSVVYHIKYRDTWKNVSQPYNFWRKEKKLRIFQ